MIALASVVPVKATREMPSPNQSARATNVIRAVVAALRRMLRLMWLGFVNPPPPGAK